MGASRRKGSGRAAAAAAAAAPAAAAASQQQQQQWKVGDLVLAKMRGFPAWPAMISEPEKWGFSSISKKLFVYFYGTKQIAFCNYADIEAFTEEKKKSLMLKRQGKGADFLRALDEIIDIYETTKRQTMLEPNSGDDEVEPSAEDLICIRSRSNSCSSKEGIEFDSRIASHHKLEVAENMMETIDRVDTEEVSVASTADDLQRNLVSDKPIESASILDQLRHDPLATSTSSRKKRLRDASQHNSVLKKRLPSLGRSRNSLISDSSKTHDSTSVYNSDISSSLVPEVIQNDAESKSKKILSQAVFSHNMTTPCTASSNDCSEDIDAQVAANAYDESNELNRGIVESICHLDASRNVYLSCEDRLNENHKSCTKNLVTKKKKEANRESINITAESSILNNGDHLPGALSSTPPDSLKEIKEIIHKGDGDEHLPLVKRARVRMGKPNLEDTQCCEPVQGNGKSETSSVLKSCDTLHALCCAGNNTPSGGPLLTVKEDLNSSLANTCSSPSGKDLSFWKAKKYQLNGSMLDVEAALPPSKRIHRALEAMSANASEFTDDHPESPQNMDANASVGLSEMNHLHHSSDVKVGSPMRLQTINAFSEPKSPLQILDKYSLASQVKPCDFRSEVGKSPQAKDCNGIVMGVMSKPIVTSKKKIQQTKLIEEEVSASPSKGMSKRVSSSLDKGNNDIMGDTEGSQYICPENARDEILEPIILKENGLSNIKESAHCVPPDETAMNVSAADMISAASSASRATISSSVHSDEDSQTFNMQGASKGTPNGRCISPDFTPMKQLIAAAQAKRPMSRSTSFPYSSLDSKAIPDAIVSPSLVHKGDSSGHGSPQNDLVNHTSTIDDRIHVLQNGVRSPHVGLRLKGVNKSSNAEANATWKTFEALVYTLSRTKESIGRATRFAIDCAKYGMAGEVIELLLQYLEREQSLHKRVDLFFLVDSITQCSRNQKGDAGGVYPSLVQSVLPRLLSAAAPRGNAASENRRQCLKVLRLWLERKTLPESIVRHHMRELDCSNGLYFSSGSSRRPLRTERAINDPLREMEGMLVDEYGSNTNFQLPHLLHTNVPEDEDGNASDEKSFEAVTPERCSQMDHEKGMFETPQKNRHVLEDVDVELEMEDVSPPCEVKMISCTDAGVDTVHSHHQVDQQCSLPFAPPLPEDRPPSPPPLPSSPPPFVTPCSTACAVVSQWQSGVHVLVDAADLDPSRNALSVQNKQNHPFGQQLSNQNASLMPSKPATYYGANYGCVPTQMPPPPPVSFSTCSASNPAMHSQNNLQPLVSNSLSDTAYHVQPPPPTVSNQFSYVHSEPPQRAPSWGNCSFPERFPYVHESHRSNFHCDQGTSRQLQHEQFQHQHEVLSSSTLQAGPSHFDKIEAPAAAQPHFGRPSDPPPVPCNEWPLRPRMLNYSTPTSRPPVEGSTPKMAGTCGYWRPR